MNDTYSTVALIKHYGWHARDIDHKPALALHLLEAALRIAKDKLRDQNDLLTQLRRDIADLNHVLGSSGQAIREYTKIGYDFYAGDILLEKGEYDKALKIYEEFHKSGRFRIHWRLWRCSFLLGNFRDVLEYVEDHTTESPKRIITELESRALAIATVKVYGKPLANSKWAEFKKAFPNCAHILDSKIGDSQSIAAVAERWLTDSGYEKLTKRLIGKSKTKTADPPQDVAPDELESILQKAHAGVWDIPEVTTVTATTVLKSLASSNSPLDGKTIVDNMAKGLIHPIILESQKEQLSQIVDLKLSEFKDTRGLDLVSLHRDKILGNFGYYDKNEVSEDIKSILLSAESKVRIAAGLPARGEGWLGESEMVRLLTQKFAPNKVTRQYSPKWLRGLRFDAYVDNFQLAVEYQGEQHFRPIDLFGGDEGFAQTVARDKLKRELASHNNVTLEHIKFDQNIDEETTRLAKKYLPNKSK